MSNKKYNVLILAVLLSTLTLTVTLNYLIDPFAVFNTHNALNIVKPRADKNERISKIPELKLNKTNIDGIWVGSSKTGWGLDVDYDKNVFSKNLKNLTLSSCSFNEAVNMAKNAILLHPEIKEVYFGVDFHSFGKNFYEEPDSIQIIDNENLTRYEVLPLVLALDMYSHTFKTISANLKAAKQQKSAATEKEYNPKIAYRYEKTISKYYKDFYRNYDLDEKKFKQLAEFIDFANDKGIKIVVFVTGNHISERILINNTDNLEAFYQFKEKIAEITPYYDFSIISKYTTDEIRPNSQYFRDAAHMYSFLRKKMSQKLLTDSGDFGVYITQENFQKELSKDKNRFDIYLENNQDLVQQVKKWSK